VQLKTPQLPFVSNVTGTWIQPHEAMDPHYWAQHLRGTVRFADGLRTVLATRPAALVEVGPGQTLTGLAGRQLGTGRSTVVVSTTPRAETPGDAAPILLDAIGKLWERGVAVDWKRMDEGSDARRVPLPTYSFERERHWIDALQKQAAKADTTPVIERLELEAWFSVPTWERMPRVIGQRSPGAVPWVVFVDRSGVADAMVATLRSSGARVLTVHAADAFRRVHDDAYELAPDHPGDYERLTDHLRRDLPDSVRIAHCWNL
jgi:phthiocerol/phenolphthiocerol synthesis type-I polyketide synthase E